MSLKREDLLVTEPTWHSSRQASVADLVEVLRGEEGVSEKEAFDLDDGTDGTEGLVVMYLDKPGRYLLVPLEVARLEQSEEGGA